MGVFLTSIARQVADRRGVPLCEVLGLRGRKAADHARQELMWVLRHERGLTFTRIGMYLHRNHATVRHGVKRHEARLLERGGAS